MYVDSCKTGKYIRHLLRECYRENGKVMHRTIANISHCKEEEIEAIKLALKHKEDLKELCSIKETVSYQQGLSVGAVWTVFDIAKRIGIVDALGSTIEGKLALWQVIARVIDQGSRLSAVRLACRHAACDILGLKSFNEDDLYINLDWLCQNQSQIEDCLFNILHKEKPLGLFLYDVTSSYLEGTCNELAAFGYNRDGKKGKRQIVIGLLCDDSGIPLSIEVFAGNTQDPATVGSQIRKVSERFGGGEVTFVGDRGMIKTKQIEDFAGLGFHYITAITKPQIESLLVKGTLQLELFDQDLAEVETNDGIRYILRQNPLRIKEIQKSRDEKFKALEKDVEKINLYLAKHLRAKTDIALQKILKRCDQMKITGLVKLSIVNREIIFAIDEEALSNTAELDGCYVIKTDLTKDKATKETVHARYKDLSLVEWAFRISKTVELEMRPINVRLESRTRGHAFVVMMAYRIVKDLAGYWQDLNLTVEDGIKELSTLCATEMLINGTSRCNKIPEPRSTVQELLIAANVRLPKVLPCSGIHVTTRKKLTENRKKR